MTWFWIIVLFLLTFALCARGMRMRKSTQEMDRLIGGLSVFFSVIFGLICMGSMIFFTLVDMFQNQ